MKYWQKFKELTDLLKNIDRKEAIFLICLVFFMAIFAVMVGYPVINLDTSIEGRLFWLYPNKKSFSVGEVVFFKFKGSKYFKRGARFIKIIACLPGDFLTVKGRCFYCNSSFIGCAKRTDRQGNPAPLFKYNGRVPPDRYFVIGTNRDSYDSRYWGFVERNDIKGVAYRIF